MDLSFFYTPDHPIFRIEARRSFAPGGSGPGWSAMSAVALFLDGGGDCLAQRETRMVETSPMMVDSVESCP
jgi:hypothetical protein